MIDINQLYMKLSAREESHGWDGLSKAEQIIVIVMQLWYEVGNGGFNQYFFNSTGDAAQKAPNAFREIGAPQTADVIKRANDLFGPGGSSKNRLKRQAQLKTFSESQLDKFDELDKFIFDDPKDLEELLCKFVLRNSLKR